MKRFFRVVAKLLKLTVMLVGGAGGLVAYIDGVPGLSDVKEVDWVYEWVRGILIACARIVVTYPFAVLLISITIAFYCWFVTMPAQDRFRQEVDDRRRRKQPPHKQSGSGRTKRGRRG